MTPPAAPAAPAASPAPAARPAAAPATQPDDPFAPAKPAAPTSTGPLDDDPFAPIKKPEARPTAIASDSPARLNPPLAADLRLDAAGRLPLRQWTDNSGQFRVQGRLILIMDGKVRLLKETGRTTTVPLDRLSAADRTYIERVVAEYGSDIAVLALVAAR
jgi:hypothetical protein